AAQRAQPLVDGVDIGFEPLDLLLDDAQRLVAQLLAGVGRGKLGAEVEQIVLDAAEHRVEFRMRVLRVQPRQPDAGIGLVDRAVGGDAQIVLRPPLAGAERGGAVVAGAGVDLVQDDHSPSPQPREYQSARTMKISAKNWRMTRACISLFEVLPEPPRIMLMSPRASTIT